MPDRSALPRPAFPERLGQLARRYHGDDPQNMSAMVRSVLGTSHADLTAGEAALLAEIEDLAATVAAARAEIAALGADEISTDHISSVNDELDAIVTHTASATESILESCEQIEATTAWMVGDDARILQGCVTRIYEACSFQDLTGQRITKVVAALQTIESKVAYMVDVLAPSRPAKGTSVMGRGASVSLQNGPQLPANAMGQSDIDALLASFD